MTANERRMAILDVLIRRKSESVENLAFEFEVANSTIRRDLTILSLDYPIYTVQGHGGGVYIDKNYRLGMKYLTATEQELLERLSKGLSGQDSITIRAIMEKFSQPNNGGKK